MVFANSKQAQIKDGLRLSRKMLCRCLETGVINWGGLAENGYN